MRATWTRSLLIGFGTFLIALLGTDCILPPGDGPLFLETTAMLPPLDSSETLLAAYDSSDGRARISVFPGTVLPKVPLTVEMISTDAVAGPLRSNSNDFALRLGPDGSQFNVPVRLSLLIGGVAQNSDGSFIVPTVEVVTEDAAKVEMLSDPQMEVTDDGLLIAHVGLNHFSDAVYRLKVGLDVVIDSPADDAVYLVAETIGTRMTVRNNTDDFMRVQAIETNKAPVGPVTYNSSRVQLPSKSTKAVGIGSCKCTTTGMGWVAFELKGDYAPSGEIDPSWVHFKKFRNVNCTLLETQIVVTFNPETHTTHYSVSTFHTTQSTGYQRQELFRGPQLSYRWTSAGTCGTFGNPGDFPANSYEHEGCSASEEAAARIKVEVTYTADDGRVIKRSYDMPSRANEGKGPIQF